MKTALNYRNQNTKFDLLTIGHSTRSIDELLDLLQKNNVNQVVDIRTIARSAHNPQFNADTLGAELEKKSIGYLRMKGLGGLRHPRKNLNFNQGWKNASFRGFADYMQTPEFEKNLQELITLSNEKSIILMCAEVLPWRCHRSLISDALLVRNIIVGHIINKTEPQAHKLTPWARVKGLNITYPEVQQPAGTT